jgi:hypothetical protein
VTAGGARAADKITIDMQGHSLTGSGAFVPGADITDLAGRYDVIVIKNGTIKEQDSLVVCPSDVTFNTSSAGFPAFHSFGGGPCRTVGND